MDSTAIITIGTALVGAGAALGGTLLGHLLQQRASRAQQQDQNAQARRAEILAAVTALVSALDDHRRAQIIRARALALNPRDPEQVDRDHSPAVHETRSALTTPRLTLRMICPALTPAAEAAVAATFALRGAPTLTEIGHLRVRAKAAGDVLVEDARAQLEIAS
ncbi:protein kilB [Kitasatospora sp. NPDC002040]|uniref:protein kilB n=1 Tax=Kitasatospora sp. NPDC002040 TaxID=3154661 RepID=UPI00331B3A39